MTIYDLFYVMDNMNYDVVIHNDDAEGDGIKFKGSVEDFKQTDLYDNLCLYDVEVSDLYTEGDGTLWVCYSEEPWTEEED